MRSLDNHPVRNNCVLDHYHDAVADDEAQLFTIGIFNAIFIDNLDIAADVGIFVDGC